MEFKVKGKTVELQFTFNSFRFMEDLDFGILEEAKRKPFKLISMTEQMLFGALNSDPNKKVSEVEMRKALDAHMKDGNSFLELYEHLMKLMEESDFFKSLQEDETK